jgi:hypothetical protein
MGRGEFGMNRERIGGKRIYYCVTARGAAGGISFVETGSAETGSGDEVVMGAVGSLVGFGDPVVMEDGILLVTVGDELDAEAGGSLMIVGDEFVREAGGLVDWVNGSWAACVAVGVSACWLHPHSSKPASAVAAAIWIFFIDVIFSTLKMVELRSLEAQKGDLVRDVKTIIVRVLYLNSVADHEIVERAPRFVFDDNLRVSRDGKLLLGR